MSRALLRMVFERRLFRLSGRPCVSGMRAVDGSYPGMIFEAFSKRDHARTEVVQQHSGDWTMTGKVPVTRVEG
jgi:hypothetical protein